MNSIISEGHHWPRMIALVDMNAFFASIEQLDRPEWRGRPLGVTNGHTGTCIITASYEARACGIRTGMRVRETRALAPDFIQVPARPYRYAQVSSSIMAALESITPDIEIFSVDEAFLDLTACQKLYRCPVEVVARKIKHCVFEASGLLCSVGVSGDKTTAKWAAKQQKPNGLTVVEPWRATERLASVPVTELCGISTGIGRFLAQHGVYCCGDMKQIPISVLAGRFGNLGRRIWLMAQGLDPEPLYREVKAPKTIGHGKVMPPDTRDRQEVDRYLMHMCEKVATRLRRHQLQAGVFSIGLNTQRGWVARKLKTVHPTADSDPLIALARFFLEHWWDDVGVHQVHVAALDPHPQACQGELFAPDHARRDQVLAVMDAVNQRYGEFALCRAPLVKRSDMPNVIAPSWKPAGHRNTLEP
ncbi:MAG: DNA polymerase IV [Oceanospirillales bacterium LUC14_002_19_P2]|nr:MAG: DNA polymerase IV [Oceanospirillales bacterium LUC14_002_19_P2]